MLIARWLFLLAGLAACVAVGAFVVTGQKRYLVLALRIFAGTVAAGLLFFAILALGRILG
jgi:hypothetical protein